LIERSRERAKLLAEELNTAVVLHGDAANEALLREENIEDVDVFCAVTNDDEANILSAMLAKRLGAEKALCLINRVSYVDLVEGGAIDIAISPQQSTVSALLAHVRRGRRGQVHTLRRGAAEAIEAVAHGDRHNSRVVGRRLDEIKLPPGTTIGAVVRGDEVIIAHHDTLIQAEDHVILFIVDKQYTKDVERLFQVGLKFFSRDAAAAPCHASAPPRGGAAHHGHPADAVFADHAAADAGGPDLRRQHARPLRQGHGHHPAHRRADLAAGARQPRRAENARGLSHHRAVLGGAVAVSAPIPLYTSGRRLVHLHRRVVRDGVGPHHHRRHPRWPRASTCCRTRCCITARSCTGSAAWASSCWRSPCCRCSASAACSCTRPRRPAR